VDRDGKMFLKKIIIIIQIFITVSVSAEIKDLPFHRSSEILNDAVILKRILKRKPDDTVALKRLLKIYFTDEKFDKTRKTARHFLRLKKDREVAYIHILTLASLGLYTQALKESDRFLKEFSLSDSEKNLIISKRRLFLSAKQPEKNPRAAEYIKNSSHKTWISIDPENNSLLGYDRSRGKIFNYSITTGKFDYKSKIPPPLQSLDFDKLMFVSGTAEKGVLLATVRTGNLQSKIVISEFSAETGKWSAWSSPESLNPGSWNAYGNLSPFGNTIVFSSNAGSDKSMDIYFVARQTNGSWSLPAEIKNINTPLDEYSVFLHPDGKTIYFSSNGRPGAGGFDFYGARLYKNGSSLRAGKISNMSGINTIRNENLPLFVNPAGDHAFFSSPAADRQRLYKTETLNPAPIPVLFFNGNVYDADTQGPVSSGQITLRKIGKGRPLSIITTNPDQEGRFFTVLRRDSEYIVSINSDNYLYYRGKISTQTADEDRNHSSISFALSRGKIMKGFTFTAKEIYFDTASAEIRHGSHAELDNVYNFLKTNPGISINISGYTDNVGTYRVNMKLSEKRARSILKFLVRKGIKECRLAVEGFGYTKSIASNKTEDGRQKNRRVEITVTENSQ